MTDKEPEKLDLRSHDIAGDKKAELLQLFPEIRTEGGKVDFDRLKLSLGEMVDTGRERYGMNWPGKADCFKTIQQPSMGTLLPCKEESVDFDTTENMIIEGDNLEVLKLLQKSYLGKVKMIYIDPPYNTGNDFIYPDNYTESLQTYLEYSGQVDTEGKKFSTNTEADGRFHSKWMTMMYTRLFLAKNLLTDNGLLFISIDDTEMPNLRYLMNEIFGEENMVEQIIWKKRYQGAKEKHLVSIHEYILVFAKNKYLIPPTYIPIMEAYISRYYKYKDEQYEKRGPFRTQPLEAGKSMGERKNLIFSVIAPDKSKIWPKRQWIWAKERVQEAGERNELLFSKNNEGNWSVSIKQYLNDINGNVRETKQFSVIEDVYTQHGTEEITHLLGNGNIFPFPKPSLLIRKLMDICLACDDDCVFLDFFAGSGTSAHAIIDFNFERKKRHKYILVQLPEPTGREDYKTIADITKERVRRVIKKIKDEQAEQKPNAFDADKPKPDLGFKVFKLSESNFKTWKQEIPTGNTDALGKQLDMHIDHILQGRSRDDILYEILLKSGFPLTTKIEKLKLAGKTVFSIAEGAMFICLEKELTHEAIKAMADLKPERVVCLDEGFAANDQLKTNAVQTMKTKGILKFETV